MESGVFSVGIIVFVCRESGVFASIFFCLFFVVWWLRGGICCFSPGSVAF